MRSSDQTTNDESTGADDGLIEVATFVVRTLLSRRFIFLRIIALRATLEATLAEKSSPLPCLHALLRCGSDSSVGTERAARRGDYCGRCPSNDQARARASVRQPLLHRRRRKDQIASRKKSSSLLFRYRLRDLPQQIKRPLTKAVRVAQRWQRRPSLTSTKVDAA